MAVNGSGGGSGPTAVIADRQPLVRVGLTAALEVVGVTTVALVDELKEGVETALRLDANLLVLGADDLDEEDLAGQIGPLRATRIVVLATEADRSTLAGMFGAGADAVALRTIAPEDFGALVCRVLAGERSIDPALMSVLLELARDSAVPSGPDPSRPGASATVTSPTSSRLGEEPPGEVVCVPLTTKERQVLARLAEGDSNAEIAAALFVSPATVKTHLAHIYTKLGVGSRHGAMLRAKRLGLLP